MIFLPIFWKIWYLMMLLQKRYIDLDFDIITRTSLLPHNFSIILFWIYKAGYTKERNKLQFSSRNLNLKSLESAATRLLRFSNICWWSCIFPADACTISMKNIFNVQQASKQACSIIIHRKQFRSIYIGSARENIIRIRKKRKDKITLSMNYDGNYSRLRF